MERILVPTDFSLNAAKALDYAIQIARRSKAEIFLIHVAEAYLAPTEVDSAKKKIETIAATIRDTEQVPVSTEVIAGTIVNSILDASLAFKADIVILGTMGSSGVREVIYGSKTAEVIGNSSIPVLAVPLLSEWKAPEKIILAINKFSEASDMQLSILFSLAAIFQSEIQITTFTDLDDDYVEDYAQHEQDVAACRDRLKAIHHELEIHAVHLAGKNFRESVQHWIDNNSIDMLVMLTHKRGLFESIFNKSVTKKMSYQTNIPLLAIPVMAG